MALKILVELSKDKDPLSGNEIGTLDIQAHQISSSEYWKIRDEIEELAPGSGLKEINYIHLDAGSLIAQVRGANEETVRWFEEAGWSWNLEASGNTAE